MPILSKVSKKDDVCRAASVNQYLANPPALNVCLNDKSICVWVTDEVDIFFGDDAMDLPEVISALSLVLEVQGGASGDGHYHPEG